MNYLLSFLSALAVSVGMAFLLIPLLRRLKAGQSIKEIGPIWHKSKEGTPTMGGLLFIAGTLVAMLPVMIANGSRGSLKALTMYAFALTQGAIGFWDDMIKVRKKHNDGLRGKQKLLLQIVTALLFVWLLSRQEGMPVGFSIPFTKAVWRMPAVLYIPISVFIVVGTGNSVNLTDGIDGLVSGVSLPTLFCLFGLAVKRGETAAAFLAIAMAAGLIGFLIFNFHPAKVFMGDTGSLFLGGVIAALAFGIGQPLLLIPLGIVYIVEALSDIIQVGWFKLSHGKRIFKMAPIHHHFEKCGWNELKIFFVFSGVSLLFALLTYFLL